MRSTRTHLARILTGTIGVAAVAASLTGCSSSSGGSPSAGGTLTLIQSSAPSSLDPAKANAGPAAQYTDLSYSSLLTYTAGGKFEPLLAKSWKWVGTGNKEMQITFRDNVKFSDGAKLTAAAEKKYMEYFLGANAAQSGPAKGLIASITIPSANVIDFRFTSAYPDAPFAFTEGATWGSPISPTALDSNQKQLGYATFGAGPYMLSTSGTTTGSQYTFVKNPKYFDTAAQKWDKVVVKVIANANSALQAVATGTDAAGIGGTSAAAQAKSSGLQVSSGQASNYELMLTDRGGHIQPALAKLQVRQALNYAVDRDALAKALGGTANEQVIAVGTVGHYSGDVYSYDPAKAKQLLAAAGYSGGFSFTIIVPAYDDVASKAAQAMAADLKKVGVTMNLNSQPDFQSFQTAQGSKKYSGDIEPWGAPTAFAVGQTIVLPTGNVNPFKDSDAQLNSLFAAGASASTSDQSTAWQAFSKAITEKAWFVPLLTQSQTFYATKGIDLKPSYKQYPNPLTF